MDIERRFGGIEARDESGGPRLQGYAALYDVETVIGDFFRERIAPGAFDEAVGRDDVRALFNHDPNQVLGRTTAGTLRLSSDARGLFYDVELNPDDPEALRVYRLVRRGDVSQSSFGFRVTEADPFRKDQQDKLPLRVIRKVELFDVSPVTFPAYPQTSVAVRDAAAALRAAPAWPWALKRHLGIASTLFEEKAR